MRPVIVDKKTEVMGRVCFHRGIGQENTLNAIRQAIVRSPFLVEFDIQWYEDDLHLGHPPEVSATLLAAALNVFKQTDILPKIDSKLQADTIEPALKKLSELLAHTAQKALINISGNLEANQYMQAEAVLMDSTQNNVLLNIDLERYAHKTNEEILEHIRSLARSPFSISPNLEDDITKSIQVGKDLGIPHIHFWSSVDKRYSIDELYDKFMLCRDNGFEVYFDIKLQNISF